MRRRGLFLDTSVLLAAIISKDAGHEEAVRILSRVSQWGSVHTSDYVVAEALNYVRMKMKRAELAEKVVALTFGEDDEPPLVDSVLRVHGARFAAALERYRREFARGLSFTDWSSVVLMEEERLSTIATFDGGFRGIVDVVPV
jgi:predicted nucleic acid-binding protein